MSTEKKELKLTKSDEFAVPPYDVDIVEGWNLRPVNVKWVKEIKNDIKKHGQLEAVICARGKDGRFKVREGEHRTRAIKELYAEGEPIKIRVKLEAKGTSESQAIINALNGSKKLAFSPMAYAEGVRRLLLDQYTMDEIADELHISTTYANQYNSLNAQPRKFKSLIELGIISTTLAFELIDEDRVEKFLSDYDAGLYTPKKEAQITVLIEENPEAENTPKPVRITRKQVDKVNGTINSYKSFKKWAASPVVIPDHMPAHKRDFYSFLLKMQNNEVNELDFAKYFKED